MRDEASLHSAAIASTADMASCRACLILPTLLRHKDDHLAVDLQSPRTDELIDKREREFSEAHPRKLQGSAQSPNRLSTERILPNDQAY